MITNTLLAATADDDDDDEDRDRNVSQSVALNPQTDPGERNKKNTNEQTCEFTNDTWCWWMQPFFSFPYAHYFLLLYLFNATV